MIISEKQYYNNLYAIRCTIAQFIMRLNNKKITIILFIGIAILLIAIGIYFVVFESWFSLDSSDWANFGSYITGIASVINVFVFVGISILIASINSDNKMEELKIEHKKEIFSRFLNSYELYLKDLYDLKVYLAQIYESVDKIDESKIIEYYAKVRSLDLLVHTYIFHSSEDLISECKKCKERCQHLIGSINSKQASPDIIERNIKSVIDGIDDLTQSLSQNIHRYLLKEIGSNDSKGT